MRILVVTDAFPPICGGSGWSTYELVRGLSARGHDAVIVRPRPGGPSGWHRTEYDGFEVRELGVLAPNLPFIRNYFKNERLYRTFADDLRPVITRDRIDLVHAQHVLSGPPSIAAARRAGVPVVCTVRDYWPVCYWADLIYDYEAASLCPACTPSMMTRCVRPRAGAFWPATLPLIPYMRANLAQKRRALAGAHAVVAVSSAIARDLRARAPELEATRLEVIPNPIDISGLQAAADRLPRPLDRPYALYLGKLAPNKGVSQLIPVLERAKLDWPLIVAGDGPDRPALEAAARRSGCDVRFTGWLDREPAMAWLRHASLLVFPSYGPESLSRVLLEASAFGVPVAAMRTGGTPDILTHEVSGLLSDTATGLADQVARLRRDEALRARLGAAARVHVLRHFDATTVVARIEALYADLLQHGRRG